MELFILIATLLCCCSLDVRAEKPHYPAKHRDKAYKFSYNVKGDYPKINYGHQEGGDGDVVYGSYFVTLPDGRTQIVKYKADGYNGYVADVKYDGYSNQPTYSKPETNYKTTPKNHISGGYSYKPSYTKCIPDYKVSEFYGRALPDTSNAPNAALAFKPTVYRATVKSLSH